MYKLSICRGLVTAAAGFFVACAAAQSRAADDPIQQAAQAAERTLQARVGYAVVDTGSGRSWRQRADERFPMASTAKALVCGALLARGEAAMTQPVRIEQADILSYAPDTRDKVGQQVAAAELCRMTLHSSDNTAVNLVLEVLGGPPTVTRYLRQIGDPVTRLDRDEPTMNEGTPGDPRDTTTPDAMARTLQALVLGDALDAAGSRQLRDWLLGNQVGGPLLRAGVPADWQVADRTGNGGHGTRGIVAVMWPPGQAPVVAAIYITETGASLEARNAAIADIGRAIAATLGARPGR